MMKTRRMPLTGHIARKSNAHRVMVGKPERKRPQERPKHSWEDTIKMSLKDIEWRYRLNSCGSG
jgi:hypothetical protein